MGIFLCLSLPSCAFLSGDLNEKEILELQKEITKKDQRILELENDLQFFKKKLALSRSKKTNGAQKSMAPVPMYKRARSLLLEENFIQSGELFKTFVKKYPHHDLADNALYWQGESHYSLGRFAEAIEIFKRLIMEYPVAEKVPDAMLKTAYSYLCIEDANRANYYLKQVLLKYPFSSAAEKAQKKLKVFN